MVFFLDFTFEATVVLPDTAASLPILFTIFCLIPFTPLKSLTDLNLPCSVQYLMIALAFLAPIPVKVCNSASHAVLILTAAKALKLKVSASNKLSMVFSLLFSYYCCCNFFYCGYFASCKVIQSLMLS